MPAPPVTWRLRVWTRFLVPLHQVWLVKTDIAQVREEFRPWMDFRPEDPQALCEAVRSGHPGRFAARLWPLGLRWTTELVESVPEARFVDRSANGLYLDFEHRHLFEPTEDGCRYVDDVTFVPRPPLPGPVVARITAALFRHRHRRSAARLPHDPQATAVAVLRQVLTDGQDPETPG